MKRLGAALCVSALLAVVFAPLIQASADQRSPFRGSVAVGPTMGGFGGNGFVRPIYPGFPPVVVYPAPPAIVFGPVHYPAATCWDLWVDGYWSAAGWIPPHWERLCR